jgi:hypothetical protein
MLVTLLADVPLVEITAIKVFPLTGVLVKAVIVIDEALFAEPVVLCILERVGEVIDLVPTSFDDKTPNPDSVKLAPSKLLETDKSVELALDVPS